MLIYVAGNSGNQAFLEMPGIPVIAKAILGISFILTSFQFWEKAQHQQINFINFIN